MLYIFQLDYFCHCFVGRNNRLYRCSESDIQMVLKIAHKIDRVETAMA